MIRPSWSGHLECANCGRDVSEVEDARTAGLRVFCCRRCYVFSSRTREVPAWGKEHAVAWADPWEDLSYLPFAELVDDSEPVPPRLRAGAQGPRDVAPPRPGGGGQNGALDRLAAARQLTERIREAPAYYEVSPPTSRPTARAAGGMAGATSTSSSSVYPGDSLARPFVPAVCVAFLAVHPLEAPELVARVDRRSAGRSRARQPPGRREPRARPGAFGFTMNISESTPRLPRSPVCAKTRRCGRSRQTCAARLAGKRRLAASAATRSSAARCSHGCPASIVRRSLHGVYWLGLARSRRESRLRRSGCPLGLRDDPATVAFYAGQASYRTVPAAGSRHGFLVHRHVPGSLVRWVSAKQPPPGCGLQTGDGVARLLSDEGPRRRSTSTRRKHRASPR